MREYRKYSSGDRPEKTDGGGESSKKKTLDFVKAFFKKERLSAKDVRFHTDNFNSNIEILQKTYLQDKTVKYLTKPYHLPRVKTDLYDVEEEWKTGDFKKTKAAMGVLCITLDHFSTNASHREAAKKAEYHLGKLMDNQQSIFVKEKSNNRLKKEGLSAEDVRFHTDKVSNNIDLLQSAYTAHASEVYLKKKDDLPRVQKKLGEVLNAWNKKELPEAKAALSKLHTTLVDVTNNGRHIRVAKEAVDHLGKLIDNRQSISSWMDDLSAGAVAPQLQFKGTSWDQSERSLQSRELSGSLPSQMSPAELSRPPEGPDDVGPWAAQRAQELMSTHELEGLHRYTPYELPEEPEPQELPGSLPSSEPWRMFVPEGDGSYPDLYGED